MSTLTKVFVIFVTVLSIFLVALTVSFVAQVDDLQGEIDDSQRRVSEADRRARVLEQDMERERDRVSRIQEQYQQQVSQYEDQVNQLRSQLAQSRDSLRDARANLERWEASLERLSAADVQKADLLDSLQSELQNRREETVDLRGRLVETTDAVTARQAEADSLERQVRRLREQMTALQEENQQLENRLAQVPQELLDDLDPQAEAVMEGPTPTQQILGQIMQLEQVGDDVLVQINVGSNDGVQEQMRFMVHRDGQYLGRLIVDRVEPDAAVGYMTLMQNEVQQGDAIFAGGDL